MNGHVQSEDLELYILGTLEGEERQWLRAHLGGCVECRRQLAEARGRAALLALAAPAQTPAPRVKEELLARVRTGRPGFFGFRIGVPLWKRWAVPALALVTITLLFVSTYLVRENGELSQQVEQLRAAARQFEAETARARAVLEVLTAPETQRVTLVAAPLRPLPQGKALYHSRKGLLFYVTNLPALPSQQTYQLWLVPAEGNPISAGTFMTDARGDGSVILPPLPPGVAAKAFAVTVEPAGGVPRPTGPKVLVGTVS